MQTTTFNLPKFHRKRLAIELICYAYILLFLYASIYKLLDIGYFFRQLAQSPLIGSYSGFLTYFVPIIELVAVALLMYPPWRKIGLWLGVFNLSDDLLEVLAHGCWGLATEHIIGTKANYKNIIVGFKQWG